LGPNALAAQADGKASDSFPQAERLGNTLRLFSAYPDTKTSPNLEQGTNKLTPKPMRGFLLLLSIVENNNVAFVDHGETIGGVIFFYTWLKTMGGLLVHV
jgi:hypothetical protein